MRVALGEPLNVSEAGKLLEMQRIRRKLVPPRDCQHDQRFSTILSLKPWSPAGSQPSGSETTQIPQTRCSKPPVQSCGVSKYATAGALDEKFGYVSPKNGIVRIVR